MPVVAGVDVNGLTAELGSFFGRQVPPLSRGGFLFQ
jgi:hypothetical protein